MHVDHRGERRHERDGPRRPAAQDTLTYAYATTIAGWSGHRRGDLSVVAAGGLGDVKGAADPFGDPCRDTLPQSGPIATHRVSSLLLVPLRRDWRTADSSLVTPKFDVDPYPVSCVVLASGGWVMVARVDDWFGLRPRSSWLAGVRASLLRLVTVRDPTGEAGNQGRRSRRRRTCEHRAVRCPRCRERRRSR